MKSKILLTGLFTLLFAASFAQFGIPPGGIPGFPSSKNCPPGVWCHPEGAGMSLKDSDIDAVNSALKDPEGCCCACALGKWFIDVVKPLYPDCYPNCNIATNVASGGSDEKQINATKEVAAKGKITAETHQYFYSVLPAIFAKNKWQATAIEGVRGSKFKLTGMWVYNEKEKNEFNVITLEPIDLKSGVTIDRLYFMFNKENMLVMNQAWINAKKRR